MREGAKRRLAGGAVIVVLAVAFLPMLFEGEPPASPEPSAPPGEPEFDSRFPASGGAADTARESLAVDDRAPALSSSLGGILERDLHQADPGQPGQIRQGESTRLGLASEPPRYEQPERFGQVEEDPLQPPVVPATPVGDPPAVTRKPAPVQTHVATVKPVQKPVQPPQKQKKEPEEPRKKAEQKAATPPKDKATTSVAPEPRRAAESGSSWVVQVASLGASEAAAELQQKLRGAGYAAFVEKAEVKGKTYYRVRVGPNADRAGAERTAATLRQRQKLDTLIQRQSDTAKSPRD